MDLNQQKKLPQCPVGTKQGKKEKEKHCQYLAHKLSFKCKLSV